jgi:hypothetical protein
MKLTKAKRNLIIFLIFVLTLNITKSDREWCWTKSMANDPTWVFNKEAGNVVSEVIEILLSWKSYLSMFVMFCYL